MKILFLEQFMIILSILLIILCMLMPLKNEGIFQKILNYHKIYAILLFMTSLIHGLLAKFKPGGITGIISLLVLIILFFSAVFINRDSVKWRKFHLILSIIYTFIVIIHICYGLIT